MVLRKEKKEMKRFYRNFSRKWESEKFFWKRLKENEKSLLKRNPPIYRKSQKDFKRSAKFFKRETSHPKNRGSGTRAERPWKPLFNKIETPFRIKTAKTCNRSSSKRKTYAKTEEQRWRKIFPSSRQPNKGLLFRKPICEKLMWSKGSSTFKVNTYLRHSSETKALALNKFPS
jgi:hypothetical protein